MIGSLTHWGRVTHTCVSKLTIFYSDNGLPPGRRQAIVWTNAGILLIRTSGINFSEISSEIHTSLFKKMHSKCRLRNGVHLSRPQWVNITKNIRMAQRIVLVQLIKCSANISIFNGQVELLLLVLWIMHACKKVILGNNYVLIRGRQSTMQGYF